MTAPLLQNFKMFSRVVKFNKYNNVRFETNKSIYKREDVKKINSYVLGRYVDYVSNYDKVLEKKFPSAMHVYRIFMVGMKDFYTDLKRFVTIKRTLKNSTEGFKSLRRKEIELYYKIPSDMIRIAPVLLLSALPFTNYIIFPLAYLFPRHLLSSHFWSLQQRSDFNSLTLKNRLLNYKPLFRSMQLRLNDIKGHPLHDKWGNILGLLGSGVQPTVEQILECEELFRTSPYHTNDLRGSHVKGLLRIHDLHLGWFRRTRLSDLAQLLIEMDLAILREGGVHNMTPDALKEACYIRGLNPMNMKNEDMINWLGQWVAISKNINNDNLSLLLHCPILLGYNQPSNWVLIYNKK